MDNPEPQKRGIGALGWIGMGCGGIILITIIGFVIMGFLFGPKLKKFGEDFQKDFQKNPARATATTMVRAGFGQIEMVAEDDVNKRYTVRQKQNGQLTTIYWSAKTQQPEIIPGDFSAIPKDASAPAEATPSPEPK